MYLLISLKDAVTEIGLNPYGIVIGFVGAAVGLFIVNNTGFSTRKVFLALLSAIALCGFVFHALIEVFESRAVVSILTMLAGLIAPDAFQLGKANGQTIVLRLWTVAVRLLKKSAAGLLGSLTDKPTTDEHDNI